MGQISKALGIGSQFTYKGETYYLSPWTYKIQGEFEEYLAEHAMRCVRKLAKVLPEAEYQAILKSTIRDIASGVYTFGSEEVQDCLRSTQHLIHLTWLQLLPKHPKVTKELVTEMYQEEMEALLSKVSESNADPTQPTQEASEQSATNQPPLQTP